MPAFGLNCEVDKRVYTTDENGQIVITKGKHSPDGMCCLYGLKHIAKVSFSEHGGPSTCTACGAHYLYGDVWRHLPTGEHIYLGHICAEKYSLMVDRSAYEIERDRYRDAQATLIQRQQNVEAFDAFCVKHDGLDTALKTDHPIVKDIRKALFKWHSLSDAQIALVRKLYNESITPPKPAEKTVPAPIQKGRQQVKGTVISIKDHESYYGYSLKMTVKIETPNGYWLCWGTVPNNLNRVDTRRVEKGDCVAFMAKLKAGSDPHFAFFNRPTQAFIL